MKSIILIALAIVLFSVPCQAFDQWDTADKYLLAASMTAMVVDWRQTRAMADSNGRYGEGNPVFGSHPGRGKVDLIFGAGAVASVLIAHVLPSKARKAWLIGTTALSVSCIVNNVSIGVGVQW